jgi:hypothetical protein
VVTNSAKIIIGYLLGKKIYQKKTHLHKGDRTGDSGRSQQISA